MQTLVAAENVYTRSVSEGKILSKQDIKRPGGKYALNKGGGGGQEMSQCAR